ncbi:MAG: Asp-tRNA(Asn)/Glu-tRNA(Gln) amidotransferase subunit GatA [Nitrososphaerota archaeon]|nr:Asp-tRNA(Asn)/Glu-tRNA(Gln) amidotransferase subunit GatA [Nitrososphaerota archaeon]
MAKPYELSAIEVVEKIRLGELTAEDYIESILERIGNLEDRIRAFITLTPEESLRKAREVDQKVRRGEKVGRLAGLAVAVKDNISTKNLRTTCASRMLANYIPPYDATVITKLKAEDAIIIGKTNMDEFAMGSTTETSYFGATRNPWNLEKVPGGSSGGSAAAVIAEEATVALGSDTGGSIRCPSSFCSTFGLKPTYGLVSRCGLISYANSLEQIGPITREAQDSALILSVIAGHDPLDSTSANFSNKDYLKTSEDEERNYKIGIIEEFFGEGVEDDVKECVMDAVSTLEDLGATVEEVSIPSVKYALASYYIIAMSEASSNLARYDGLRYGYRKEIDEGDWSNVFSENRRLGFGQEVRRRIILGTYALSAGYYNQYYLKALRIRTLLRKDFEKALKRCNVLVGPTMPVLPFNIGEKIDDPLALYMCDILTVPANLTGNPAASIPCGFRKGLPVGMQIIGKPFDEDTIFKIAFLYQQNTHYHRLRPDI